MHTLFGIAATSIAVRSIHKTVRIPYASMFLFPKGCDFSPGNQVTLRQAQGER